jgi:uncharacterized protein (TIGR02677 family)
MSSPADDGPVSVLTARTEDARLPVFAYVDAEKAALYRAIMRVFIHAKERFSLHLRPEDVWRELRSNGVHPEHHEVNAALKQLRDWENLRADPDTADVDTVEEFYRERLLYQLTRRGEAAERALLLFEELLAEPGELQTSALHDIRAHLAELEVLTHADPLDGGKIHRAFSALFTRFEELTSKAQIFIGGLQRSADLQGTDERVFIAYKEKLIDYLERFVGDLTLASIDIAATLRRIDGSTASLLGVAAERSVADRLESDEHALAEIRAQWTARWQGVRRWFVSDSGEPSQADILRVRALAAIPALLAAAQAIHDRRVRRADRHQDFLTLARWFAEAKDDAAAHRLWRAAFGLAPARHLWVNDESLSEWESSAATARTSWLDAPPLRIAPRLRVSGRYDRPGAPRGVIDRSREKAALAKLAAEEHHQLEAARRRLVSRGRCLLSEIDELEREVFDLLLDLLGSALSSAEPNAQSIRATSTDGSLAIHLEPIPNSPEVVVVTSDGELRCRDYLIEIVDAVDQPTRVAAE